jgi:phosphoenolpyruvate-protein phosphotransferase (PTS system enzyme I)
VEDARRAAACDRARGELAELQQRLPADLAAILEAQSLFLEDPALLDPIIDRIANGRNAEWAVEESVEEQAEILASLDDPYLRERAADVRDLGRRLLAALMGLPAPGVRLTEPSVIIARDLTPSDTAQLDRSLVLGYATELGGPTSHSAILARSMGIPALVGAAGLLEAVSQGTRVVLDATGGQLLVNPAPEVAEAYRKQVEETARQLDEQRSRRGLPAETVDGHRVELAANIGGPQDVAGALEWGAEGVGLFRTEFLYMERSNLPDEEEQYQAYVQVVQEMAPRPVIIRTLDIGGDKEVPYLGLAREENPFLGYRALRLCLDRTELFKTQLRAILRAGVHGHVRIMFPMVATVGEFRRAKEMLAATAAELAAEGAEHVTNPEVGIMVEIPAAAVMAPVFAREVDFFSIGSNDLIQYTMAADRGNAAVSYLYRHLQPAVLHLVKQVIDAAHVAGKWAGMCGEMAGDPEAIPVLLGLGLDEFSMSAGALPPARDLVRRLRRDECRSLAAKTLSCVDADGVSALVRTLGK